MFSKFWKLIILVTLFISFLFSDLEVAHSLGATRLGREENIKFDGLNYNLGINFSPFNQLQWGLKYTTTEIFSPKYYHFNNSGLLITAKFLLSPYTKKSPYFGYNFGWLTTTLAAQRVDYHCNNSLVDEALFGYNFNLEEDSRFFIEYRRTNLYLKLEDRQQLLLENLVIGVSKIFNEKINVQRSLDKETGLKTKQEYLSLKLQENENQIERYDVLIQKYSERIFNEPDNQQIKEERDFLIKERAELEQKNKEIKELLAL